MTHPSRAVPEALRISYITTHSSCRYRPPHNATDDYQKRLIDPRWSPRSRRRQRQHERSLVRRGTGCCIPACTPSCSIMLLTPRSVRGPLAGRCCRQSRWPRTGVHGRTARGNTHLHVEPRAFVRGNRQSRIFRCSSCVSRSLTPDNREVVPKPDYCPVGAMQEIVEQH